MEANSFLIEIYFRARRESHGVLVCKRNDQAGYQLWIDDGSGRIQLAIRSGQEQCALREGPKVNDGQWHHLIAEVDRRGNQMRLYLDGKLVAGVDCKLSKDASLSNTEDFLVGKGPDGDYFEGEIDFLRVSRGTLEQARTTIEELYAWQFDGPFLRDFAGKEPMGKRDASALEKGQSSRR